MAGALLGPISACANGPAPVPGENTSYAVNTPAPSPENAPETLSAPAEAAKSFWPWSTQPKQQPPPVKPYKLPTLAGDGLNFHAKPPALVKAPAIDADAVYRYVLDCYPEESKWKLDLNLRGQVSSLGTDLLTSDAGSTALGSNYVAIVASMPLYSSTELNREKEREHVRRQNAAATVSEFISAIAERNHAVRELALYRSLEARSALRVQRGIVDATEQVGFLEKVAAGQARLIQQESNIMATRLKLTSMCDPQNAATLNQWLQQVARVPLRETRPLAPDTARPDTPDTPLTPPPE